MAAYSNLSIETNGSTPVSALTRLKPATHNYILNNLPEEDFARLAPDLEQVKLSLGQIIYRAEETIDYLYFPSDSMVSVIAASEKGNSVGVSVIGREGIIGSEALLGAESSLNQNIIQLPDGALRIKTAAAKREFDRGGAFHDLALSFIHLVMLQISQTALCNRLHTVDERLARWLLLSHDRAEADKLTLTQEVLGMMLGANRPSVTNSSIVLQNAGAVKYTRGLITILDHEKLEEFSCECYRTIKEQFHHFRT